MQTTFAILTLTMMISQRPAHPDVVDRFTEMTCVGPSGFVPYRIYVPSTAVAAPHPMVIWFHGRGEAGADNREHLAWLDLIFGVDARRKGVLAIVVAMQTEADHPSWSGSELDPSDPMTRLDAVVKDVIDRHRVDRQRIYLAGISQGASGCWQYARRHPGRFAAMLPMATCSVSGEAVEKFQRLPIWAFQSAADGPAQVRRMRQVVTQIQDVGGPARLTVVPSLTHDCWTVALADYHAWSWLLDQRRGQAERRYSRTLLGRYLTRWHAFWTAVALFVGAALYARHWTSSNGGDCCPTPSTTSRDSSLE